MALDDWEQGHYKDCSSSVVCEDPNAISLQVQFLSFVQELFELNSEIEPFPKTKPIPKKLHHGILRISKLFIICLSMGTNILGFLHLNSKNFWILLWAFGGFPWLGNFFYSYCLCLHSCKNKYKNSVIPAVYIFENGTSGLGFHLARCLDILEVLLLLLLGYCQDIVAFALSECFMQGAVRCWKGERATSSLNKQTQFDACFVLAG